MSASRGPARPHEIIRFADFELDPGRQILYKRGISLKLQPQPLRILTLLLISAPRVVSREEIRRHVWGDYVTIETDGSINFCIRQIRSALSDVSVNPRFLETVPREGYRFIGAIQHPAAVAQAAQDAGIVQHQALGPDAVSSASLGNVRRGFRSGLFALALGVALSAIFFFSERFPSNDPQQIGRVTYVTNDAGVAQDPAVSPSANEVAFSWNGHDNVEHIYSKSFASRQNLELTHEKYRDRFPAWSPDGKQIAFVRFISSNDARIVSIPAGGGRETVLRQVRFGLEIMNTSGMLAFTADGRWLCFTDQSSDGVHRLFLLERQSGLVKPLHRVPSNWNESAPAFSSDGNLVAFVRFSGMVNTQIFMQKLDGSQQTISDPLPIVDQLHNPMSPCWQPNRQLAFVGDGNFMQASWNHHVATQLYASNLQLSGLTYDPAHARFITSRQISDQNIWALSLHGTTAAGSPQRLVHSGAENGSPALSPDGKWLAFESDRSGANELWLSDPNGGNPRQITQLSAYVIGRPQWSPDSKFIAFHARRPKTAELYLLRLEDNTLRKLTAGEPSFVYPSFSSDGRRLYCMQVANGDLMLWQINIAQGQRRPLWRGILPGEAPGRHTLIYLRPGEPGIFERSLIGDAAHNPEIRLTADVLPGYPYVLPTRNGVFYTMIDGTTGRQLIRFYSFALHRSSDVGSTGDVKSGTLALRPDGSGLLYDGSAYTERQLLAMQLNH